MSSRKEQKERARADRVAREEMAAAAQRRSRLIRMGIGGVIATVVIVGAVALSQSGDDTKPGTGADGSAAVRASLRGIPQDGIAVGSPDAPVTLTEFADLQCPFCAQFATGVLPKVVDRYVRDGKVRIVFRNLTFLGSDSERAALAASAAGKENKLWQFAELFYRNQGPENSGYATDDFIAKVARGAGADPEAAVAAANSGARDPALTAAAAEAQRQGVDSTPTFLIAAKGGPTRKLGTSATTFEGLSAEIDKELAKK